MIFMPHLLDQPPHGPPLVGRETEALRRHSERDVELARHVLERDQGSQLNHLTVVECSLTGAVRAHRARGPIGSSPRRSRSRGLKRTPEGRAGTVVEAAARRDARQGAGESASLASAHREPTGSLDHRAGECDRGLCLPAPAADLPHARHRRGGFSMGGSRRGSGWPSCWGMDRCGGRSSG
jgi:hypothetical protein